MCILYVTIIDVYFNTNVCMSSGFGPSPTSYFWSGHAHIFLSALTARAAPFARMVPIFMV